MASTSSLEKTVIVSWSRKTVTVMSLAYFLFGGGGRDEEDERDGERRGGGDEEGLFDFSPLKGEGERRTGERWRRPRPVSRLSRESRKSREPRKSRESCELCEPWSRGTLMRGSWEGLEGDLERWRVECRRLLPARLPLEWEGESFNSFCSGVKPVEELSDLVRF